jgi:uncharacterized protein
MIDRACISINNTCNLYCRYCNFRKTGVIVEEEGLTSADVETVIENILNYAHKSSLFKFKLGIVGTGEPFLDFDKIHSAINYAVRHDAMEIFMFYVITNGTLVDDEKLDFFYEHRNRVTLNFSLDGYEELHNYGKTSYKETCEGIALYEKCFKEKPIINCTVNRQTLIHRELVLSWFERMGFEKINFSELIDVIDDDLRISHGEFLDFLRFVAERGTIVFRQNRSEKKYDCRTYGQLCGVGRTNIFITKQGIYPCCRFYKKEEYRLSDFDEKLDIVEADMKQRLNPVNDGECYFNRHILKEEF